MRQKTENWRAVWSCFVSFWFSKLLPKGDASEWSWSLIYSRHSHKVFLLTWRILHNENNFFFSFNQSYMKLRSSGSVDTEKWTQFASFIYVNKNEVRVDWNGFPHPCDGSPTNQDKELKIPFYFNIHMDWLFTLIVLLLWLERVSCLWFKSELWFFFE